MTFTVFNCPIIDCLWQHRDDGPQPLADDATDDDQHAQAVLHQATLEHVLRAHYETHDAEAWVRTVNALHQELAARSAPTVCFGCYLDRHQAAQRGVPPEQLPLLNPASFVVDGRSLGPCHLRLSDAPAIPGRTPGGLILDAGPVNGQGL